MDLQDIIFKIAQAAPGFLLAIILHEYAHGWVAKKFGDDTAEREGRLSLNPAVHVSVFGTIIWPLVMIISGGQAFGWAKPVPIVTRNFRQIRKAVFWVSFAGPLANFTLGILSALLFAIVSVYAPQDMPLHEPFLYMLNYSIFINFLLGGFNLIPFPPLDGSRMLASFLKGEALRIYESLEQLSFPIFLTIIMLSYMNIPTISYVIMPFVYMGQAIQVLFLRMLV